MSKVFEPIKVKNVAIRNRIVVPPMVCFGYSDAKGEVSEAHIEHYETLAKGGAGLIIVEATCVAEDGRLSMDQLGLWNDNQVSEMSRLVTRCHRHGAKVLIQLHHAGDKRSKLLNEGPFSVNDLTEADFDRIQNEFVLAAKRAVMTGADGIELHGAHGYLMCQLASPEKNHRRDTYGGSLEGRLYFATSLIQRLKEEISGLDILGMRMGANEPDLETGVAIAKAYEAAGVDLLHVSAGLGPHMPSDLPEGFDMTPIVYMGTVVKQAVEVPVIAVNGIRKASQIMSLVETDAVDFVALGRPHLVDPEWSHKMARGQAPVECINCSPCKWFKDGRECPRRHEAL